MILLGFIALKSAAVPLRNDFIFFDNDQVASTYWKKFDESFASKVELRQPLEVLPLTDEAYAVVKSQLDVLWKGYKAVFPALMKSLGTNRVPEVVIINSDEQVAYSVTDFKKKKIPYLLIVYKGLLIGTTREMQIATMGHELMHLFARHGMPEISKKINTYYMTDGKSEPLGLFQRDDGKARSIISRYTRLIRHATFSSDPRLRGFPFDPRESTAYEILKGLILNSDQLQPICKSARDLHNHLLSFLAPHIGAGLLEFDVTSVDWVKFQETLVEYRAKARECFSNVKPDLMSLVSKNIPLPKNEILEIIKLTPSDFERFNRHGNVIDALFDWTESLQRQMGEIEARNDVKKFRLYNTEEQADDAAVAVLHSLGLNPLALNDLFTKFMGETEAAKCNEVLNRGQVPNYGYNIATHHSYCYRVYHARAYLKYLEENCIPMRESCVRAN